MGENIVVKRVNCTISYCSFFISFFWGGIFLSHYIPPHYFSASHYIPSPDFPLPVYYLTSPLLIILPHILLSVYDFFPVFFSFYFFTFVFEYISPFTFPSFISFFLQYISLFIFLEFFFPLVNFPL